MISKLRVKFIAISMLSMLAVLLLIIGSINVLNYRSIITDADDTLLYLTIHSGEFPALLDESRPVGGSGGPGAAGNKPRPNGEKKEPTSGSDGVSPFRPGRNGAEYNNDRFEERMSPEFPYESRYFCITLDKDGGIVSVDTSRIVAVNETKAALYASRVFGSGKTRGFIGSYRYYLSENKEGYQLIFLDCGRNLDTFRTFLTTSTFISAAGLLAVFLLIYIFSGWVFKPVAEGYEKQKRFITDAGHEIKTPLAIISADTDVLGMELGDDNEWLSDIKKQIKGLTALTNDLVYLSKMEENGVQLSMTGLCVSDMLCEMISSFALMAKAQNKSFESDIEPGLTMKGDEKALRQLFSILLDNAQKYSPEGGVIRTSLSKQNRYICFSVYNTSSVPVELKDPDRLFDRFYRTDESRNSETGGHGIGLSIAKAVTLAHHGKISAYSEDGKSLTVTAKLYCG